MVREIKMTDAVREELAKQERARIAVARVKANKAFMAGVIESLQARQRGEQGISLEDLKKQMAEG